MAVSDVIRRRAIPFTVVRRVRSVVINGFRSSETAPVSGITGHIQPLTPEELRNLAEGQNSLARYNVWSLSELKNTDQVSDGSAPTLILQAVEYWKEGPFYHALGSIVDDDNVLPAVITGAGDGVLPGLTGAGVGATP